MIAIERRTTCPVVITTVVPANAVGIVISPHRSDQLEPCAAKLANVTKGTDGQIVQRMVTTENVKPVISAMNRRVPRENLAFSPFPPKIIF